MSIPVPVCPWVGLFQPLRSEGEGRISSSVCVLGGRGGGGGGVGSDRLF